MLDWYLPDDTSFKYRPMWVGVDSEGRRVVRFIDDVPLPQEWEVDKTVRPVVE